MAITTNYNSAVAADATKATPAAGGAAVGVKVQGAFTGSFTPESTLDGVNWDPHEVFPLGGGVSVVAITAPGAWRARTAGVEVFRLRATALTAGTPVVTLVPDENTL
jgi:hypothetical protein